MVLPKKSHFPLTGGCNCGRNPFEVIGYRERSGFARCLIRQSSPFG